MHRTSFIHNRRATAFTLAAAGLALVLLGAGCSSSSQPSQGSAPSGGIPDTGTPDTGTGALPTKWATYHSDKLGITIPYPEGWYVEESADGARFHTSPPPEGETEYPAEMWISRERGSTADALDGLAIVSSERVVRSGMNVQRVIFREPFYDPPEVLLYVWERDGYTTEIGGPNRDAVERAVSAL